MSPDPLPMDEMERRRVAGHLLQAHLSGRALPGHATDVADRTLVDRIARMDAKEILATLQELYGVDWWTREEFQRAYVDGALQGWRPGTKVQLGSEAMRIVSTTCPIAADVEKDARACQACQATQRHAASLALFGQVQEVRFDRLMSRGESACEVQVIFRPTTRRRA